MIRLSCSTAQRLERGINMAVSYLPCLSLVDFSDFGTRAAAVQQPMTTKRECVYDQDLTSSDRHQQPVSNTTWFTPSLIISHVAASSVLPGCDKNLKDPRPFVATAGTGLNPRGDRESLSVLAEIQGERATNPDPRPWIRCWQTQAGGFGSPPALRASSGEWPCVGKMGGRDVAVAVTGLERVACLGRLGSARYRVWKIMGTAQTDGKKKRNRHVLPGVPFGRGDATFALTDGWVSSD